MTTIIQNATMCTPIRNIHAAKMRAMPPKRACILHCPRHSIRNHNCHRSYMGNPRHIRNRMGKHLS
jgi:hypothetical protein